MFFEPNERSTVLLRSLVVVTDPASLTLYYHSITLSWQCYLSSSKVLERDGIMQIWDEREFVSVNTLVRKSTLIW